MVKKIYQSKTFWAGVVTIATSAGLFATGEQELQEFVLGLVGFVFIVLRLMTHSSIE